MAHLLFPAVCRSCSTSLAGVARRSLRSARHASTTRPGTPTSSSRTPIKVKIHKKDTGTGQGNPAGPNPGRLVNPEYITQEPISLTSIPELQPSKFISSNVGKLYKFTNQDIKIFDNFDLPPSIKADWKPTPVPLTTIRKASVKLISRLQQAKDPQPQDSPLLTLIGQPGSGKSTVLLHALTYAVRQKWLVLYVPDVQPFVDGQHAYDYCSKNQTYHQNLLSASLLKQLSVNDFTGLNVTRPVTLFGVHDERLVEAPEPIAAGLPLSSLLQIGIKDVHFAPVILEAVLYEMSQQTLKPLLLAIDGAQNLFKTSGYVDGSFRPIDSFVLNVPRLLVSFARGSNKVSKGLTVLSASSLDTTSKSLAWDSIVKQRKPPSGYVWRGWAAYGELAKPLTDTPRIEVKNLELGEAAGIAKGLHLTRQFLGPLTDRVFARHLVSSSGNAREFRREIKHQVSF